VPDNTAKPRTLAQRYRLDELIGLGGFAEVWRAYDQQLQRAVAIKIPKATRVDSADSFLAEARRVARLRHSGIVPVHDVGFDDDRVFIVSEFMDGGSLPDRLAQGRVDQQQVIGWIARIADALDYAHLDGVIHQDVKPANILINHHDEALLGDFGIAQSAHKTGTCDPSIGTLRYMAPEQLEGRAVTPVSDVYSLAVVLHESLTGHSPFSSDDPNIIRQEITRGIAKQVSHQLTDAVAAVCGKALSRNPQERHSSAAQFAADLRRAVAPAIVPPTRSWWPMALAALACLTAGGVWLATMVAGPTS
jgi:serine/threonine protein kinase